MHIKAKQRFPPLAQDIIQYAVAANQMDANDIKLVVQGRKSKMKNIEYKKTMADTRKRDRAEWLSYIFAVLLCVVLFGSLWIMVVVAYSKIPICPNCNVRVETNFCSECGAEMRPKVNCPNCDKSFKATGIPNFCPECGTDLKEIGSVE